MSFVPTTFSGLVSSVKSITEDDSIEFEEYIPTAIHLAEERLLKELDNLGIQTVVTVTASTGSPLLAKPQGYRVLQDVYFLASSEAVQPSFKTKSFIKDYWPNESQTGLPKYISNWDKDSWVLAPTPDSNYVFVVDCTKELDHLTSANPSNYYSTNCSDALFYAVMSNMAEFMKDFGARDTVWEPKYARALEGLNNEARRARRDSSGNPENPQLNTLTGQV